MAASFDKSSVITNEYKYKNKKKCGSSNQKKKTETETTKKEAAPIQEKVQQVMLQNKDDKPKDDDKQKALFEILPWNVQTQHQDTQIHRTGSLINITVAEISKQLPGIVCAAGDPLKVKYEWYFQVKINDKMFPCGVWDYKDSSDQNQFSTFGASEVFRKIFGLAYMDFPPYPPL